MLGSWYDTEANLPLHSAAISEYVIAHLSELDVPDDPQWRYEIEQPHRSALYDIYARQGCQYAREHLRWLEEQDRQVFDLRKAVGRVPEPTVTETVYEIPHEVYRREFKRSIGPPWDDVPSDVRTDFLRAENDWRSEDLSIRADAPSRFWRAILRVWLSEFHSVYPEITPTKEVGKALTAGLVGRHRNDAIGQKIDTFIGSCPNGNFLKDDGTLRFLRRLKRLRDLSEHPGPLQQDCSQEFTEIRAAFLDGGFLRRYFEALME